MPFRHDVIVGYSVSTLYPESPIPAVLTELDESASRWMNRNIRETTVHWFFFALHVFIHCLHCLVSGIIKHNPGSTPSALNFKNVFVSSAIIFSTPFSFQYNTEWNMVNLVILVIYNVGLDGARSSIK
jgi:hypothetical protein